MLQSDPIAKEHLAKQGFGLVSSDYAFKAMAIAVNTGKPQISIMDWDWQTYQEQAPWLTSLFARLPKNQRQDKSSINTLASNDVIGKLTGLSSADRSTQITSWIEESVRHTLGISKEQTLDFGKPLTDLGLDSLLAVQLRNLLSKTIQLNLPVSLAFNYPTIAEMIVFISHLVEQSLPVTIDNVAPESKPSIPTLSAAQSAQDLLADLEKLIN
jgi:acyl carrier protein